MLIEVGTGRESDYLHAHLPGAVYLDTGIFERAPDWNIIPPAGLQAALLSLGITRHKPVVLYGEDRWGVARAAFVLRYAGVEHIHWLAGGKAAWQAAGRPLEAGKHAPIPAPTFGAVLPQHPEYLIGRQQLLRMLADPDAVVADTRTWQEHTGQVSGYSYISARGRIPGSVWIGEAPDWSPSAASLDARPDIRRTFRAITSSWMEKGLSPDRPVAFYCGTGWRASEAFWIAYEMGWRRICVYDGGWLEWSQFLPHF